jgi:glutathione-regulated potassium-efflux system ancillary protein KefG
MSTKTPTSKKTLVLLAHPDLAKSKANRPLSEGIRDLPGVTLRNLYDLYPDFRIDVEAEQKLLLEYDALVLQFPLYWYSTPALLKLWQDVVLTWGFAYGPDAAALRGKPFLIAVTTGSPEAVYQAGARNEFTLHEFLRPLQKTFSVCGMVEEPVFAVPGVYRMTPEEIQAKVAEYRARLRHLVDGTSPLE